MKRAVIAGGSGFVGKHLAAELVGQGFEVVLLSRSVDTSATYREVKWDGKSLGDWEKEIDGAELVFNLSGAPIDKKWTPEYQKVVLDSRVESSRVIGEAIRAAGAKPKAWVNASAVGFYGDREDEILSESSREGAGFLSDVCAEWEQACLVPEIPDVKQVCVRIGIVLGREGGIFPVMSKLAKLGLGGAAGSGKQWLPVIHVDDLVRLFVWAADHAQEGVLNGCCPEPVQNSEFMGALREAYGRPFSPPVPKFALNLGSGLMGKEGALILMSQRAIPTLAQSQGFEFKYENLGSILGDLTKEKS
ncbi:MAG: TIGR01777 family oxidoreductase [Fimbriimonadaceae bacterium]